MLLGILGTSLLANMIISKAKITEQSVVRTIRAGQNF